MSDDMKQPLLTFGHRAPQSTTQSRKVILLEQDETPEYKEFRESFARNIIVSSRYNIFNFLPKSLLEQFRRLANVYFLVLGIISCIGYYTNYYDTAVEPAGILAPMVIVVCISIIKDGVEDIKRHQADRVINSKPSKRVLPDGRIETTEWRNLKVGDVLIVFGDDELPADAVVLTCGGVQGQLGYVETAAIDGETNLKLKLPSVNYNKDGVNRFPFSLSPHRDRILGDLSTLRYQITAEPPNSSIHRFNAYIEPVENIIAQDMSKQVSLNEKHLLLRGSVLRATEWCLCSVIYTGADTKLSLNSKRAPSKLSSVDRIVNKTLAIAISCMLVVCVISMIFEIVWQEKDNDASYLCIHSTDMESSYPNGGGCESGSPSSYLTIFTFATLYNNFVCISMYVSLEMVYLAQSYFLSNDLNMYDEEKDCVAECHTSGMCADLGQVQYVLSDKTGTLTKNQMIVKQYSIANRVFGEPLISATGSEKSSNYNERLSLRASDLQSTTSDINLLLHNTNFFNELKLVQQIDSKNKAQGEVEQTLQLLFMRILVYCNTAMLMPDENGQQEVKDFDELVDRLQAESPDEVALIVTAAENCGILLRKRTNHEIVSVGLNKYYKNSTSSTPAEEERIEIIAINEFDSDRKMMSVIIRMPDTLVKKDSTLVSSRYLLLVKGADSSILKHSLTTHPYSNYVNHCKSHIDYFANTGLRTLAFAYRELNEVDVDIWLKEYQIASNSLTGRKEAMKACADKIERELILVGSVGIEDELQDEVAESISIMHSAGINVWMITGDKAETAIAIGKKCALIQPGKHEIERILNLSDEALRQRVNDLYKYVRQRNHLEPVTPSFVATNSESISGSNPLHEEKEMALIVDGISLEGLWSADDLRLKFVDIIQSMPTVIACRVSPLQKAALVRMVKAAPGNPVTLGIGDGANDVGMIHESRVGVGISGNEGRHAANAADFAISKFKFIVNLLFYHGRFNYIRCSKLVLYSFFKNLVLVSTLFYLCAYSGFSGTLPVDSLVFSGFNFYLGLPILVLGAMDFDIPRKDVLKFPFEAYATGRLGEMLNLKNMAKWCLFAFAQGLLIFTVATRIIGGPTFVSSSDGYWKFSIYGTGLNSVSNGASLGFYAEGFLLYTVTIFSMQYKVVAMSITPNYIFWSLWFLSFAGYFLFTWVYGVPSYQYWYDITPLALGHPQFWLAIFLIPFLLVLSDYTFEKISSVLDPSYRDALLTLLENSKDDEKILNRSESESTGGHSGVALRALSQASHSPSFSHSTSSNHGNVINPVHP